MLRHDRNYTSQCSRRRAIFSRRRSIVLGGVPFFWVESHCSRRATVLGGDPGTTSVLMVMDERESANCRESNAERRSILPLAWARTCAE